MTRSLVLAFILLVVVGQSTASPAVDLTDLRQATTMQLRMCELETDTAYTLLRVPRISTAEITKQIEHVKECTRQALAETRDLYSRTSASTAKLAAIGPLLRDFYAAWQTAIDALQIRLDESPASQRSNARDAKRRAEEAWRRLALEAGI